VRGKLGDVSSESEEVPERPRLVHPVYLDVPMMVSFLAALRGGVAFEDTMTRRGTRTVGKERELGAKVRLPPLASLLGFDASGRMGRSEESEASEETQAVRQHTASSLFNALYDALEEEQLLRRVEAATDLAAVSPGDVVEIAGDFIGNPLEPVVAFFKQAVPYFDIAQEMSGEASIDLESAHAELAVETAAAEDLRERAGKADRSGNPAMKVRAVELRQQAADREREVTERYEVLKAAVEQASEAQEQAVGIRMLSQVSDDLATTPVHDTVINAGDLKAVLTMSAEFFTDATRAHLRAGVFRAVGKVTRILDHADELNLLRRTVLGAADPTISRDMITGTVEEGSLRLETFDPIIRAPAIQVLPLAVFV